MTAVETLRQFNRTWSQRVGALDESFLGLGLPLGAARLIFEIGGDGATVRELRERLDLDSGYLSRLLRRLEEGGQVTVTPDPADRRRRLVRLTTAGLATRELLETRSDDLARTLTGALGARQQQRLTEALRTADLLVRAATVRLREVAADAPEAREATRRYVAELAVRFPAGFDPGVPAPAGPAGAAGRFVVATSEGRPVACGALRPLTREVGEMKRMWVDPSWRGAGLGLRVLAHLEDLARRHGHAVVRLDTNGTLTEAVALYERTGYRRVGRYNDNPYAELFFEKTLG